MFRSKNVQKCIMSKNVCTALCLLIVILPPTKNLFTYIISHTCFFIERKNGMASSTAGQHLQIRHWQVWEPKCMDQCVLMLFSKNVMTDLSWDWINPRSVIVIQIIAVLPCSWLDSQCRVDRILHTIIKTTCRTHNHQTENKNIKTLHGAEARD